MTNERNSIYLLWGATMLDFVPTAFSSQTQTTLLHRGLGLCTEQTDLIGLGQASMKLKTTYNRTSDDIITCFHTCSSN